LFQARGILHYVPPVVKCFFAAFPSGRAQQKRKRSRAPFFALKLI